MRHALRTRLGTNIGGAGEHNRRVVLHGLRINGAMSRAQIARSTGLVKQTVSNIMEELEREELVSAAKPVRGQRGQPATPYSIAPHGGFAVGLQIDQHRIRAAAVDLLGHIVFTSERVLSSGGLEANIELILGVMSHVTTELEKLVMPKSPRLLGIGLAMPAPTGVHAIEDDPWMAGLSETHPLVTVLERTTGLPVSLHHDASAATVAERLSGSAAGFDNFLLIFVGYGVGAGIYIGGELCRGHDRLAGEIGLIPIPGRAGSVALEELTSLSKLFRELGLRPNQPDLFSRLEEAMAEERPEVAAWIAEASFHLNWAIDVVGCILNPECVVVAGQMPSPLLTSLFSAIGKAQRASTRATGLQRPRIIQGSADLFSVAAGAAAYPIAKAFDPSLSAMLKVES